MDTASSIRTQPGVPELFTGSMPALVTPFAADGSFVESVYRDLVEWQISEGSSVLVSCGTTGEHPTMTAREHYEVVGICVDQARGRVPVIAGAGSYDTRVAIANVKAAREVGADAALVVAPFYNRPSQEGIFLHFEAIANNCDLPLILYNVPSRTVTDISVETMGKLVDACPSIIGVKDATGSLPRVSAQRAACGDDFLQLSGNDDMALAFNAHGGRGCISVTANVAPRLCAEFQAASLSGDAAVALALQDRLFALHVALFSDASPGPVKYALGRLRPEWPSHLRLPMTEPCEASRMAVDAALSMAGL
jgi:4-hydroxy-tetrahydrodipicolinate synthase